MKKTSRILSTVGLLVWGLAGCGEENTASAQTGAQSTPPSSESAENASFGKPGTGFIKLGDLQHDLTVRRCITMAGALGGDAVSTDEPGNFKVRFDFSPANWRKRPGSEGWEEAGTIRVDSKTPYKQWESGLSAVSGYNLGGIDPATLDITALEISGNGRSARGEARFLDVGALMQGSASTVTGSFALTCPGK